MSVNLRRFVDINVQKVTRTAVNPTRDTAVLFASADTNVTETATFISGAFNTAGAYVLTKLDGTTIVINATDQVANGTVFKYARIFFDNGGVKLEVRVEAMSLATLQALGTDKIIVTCAAGSNSTSLTATEVAVIAAYNAARAYAGASETNEYGPSAKIFFTNTTYNTTTQTPDVATFTQNNICVKLGDPGIEMTMMAYLTKINAYGQNTIHDYAFTIESINALTPETISGNNVTDDDTKVGACMTANVLVDTVLANKIRNVGGNLIDSSDLVNSFILIVLQQTLQEALVNVLTNKLSGAEGTVIIYNAMVAELNKYVTCGFLAAGNWIDEAWNVKYNDQTFTVIDENERMNLGYKVYVVPFAAMTLEDVQSHAAPPVYIALCNAYGIRKITVEGKVL